MSVRRLAEEAAQPQTFAFSSDNEAWVETLIRRYPEGRQQSAVIPMLMRAQDQDGWVTKAAIEHVADRLSMPMIRVLEVATFYTQFQLKPVGTRAHVQVCGTTPCMLRGSDDLKRVCREKIHPEPLHPNASGTLSWEEVECLGACVNAPMVMIFKDTYEDLTGERLAEIIDEFEAGRGESVRKGPQIDRHLSVPVGGLTTLTSFRDEDEGASVSAQRPSAANDAPPQGPGAGYAVSDESQAARADTHAAETDSSMKGPSPEAAAAADNRADDVASIDPSKGAQNPGTGREAGTRQGPTGQVERDAAEFGETAGNSDGEPRADGPLKAKGAAAEDRLVQDFKRVPGDAPRASSATEDLGNKDASASGVFEEQRRNTSDTQGNPAAVSPSGAENRSQPKTDRDTKD
ncbi:NADH-quinone oxidoreductase subunit NuoE [Aureimonas jatrophae]|uniref:NADH-quinone oxidoreductase subunit E n=1 Tax=Aureimonas jatrophae TaxID=1166073 RepID=A0A1H0MB92_9HYPH|nr:NADH-quinone oxidoreductase subunit NuoE [Aureimonas jatrophae]MBB3951154.1 NADH-quinone oxidoreductase subunit E [Aureimonas jatrophae]SDO77400.1 NADH-quinone oxidoreductase subunit E [Aureimonas jatrophae]